MNQDAPLIQSSCGLLGQVRQLFSATIIGQAMGMVRSVMLPALFTPAQLGVWNFLLMIFGYGSVAHLGLLSGMNVLVPAYDAQGVSARARRLEESVFWTNLALGGLLSTGVFISSFLAPEQFRVGLRLLIAALMVQQVYVYFHSYLRSRSRFDTLSAGMTVSAMTSTPLILILALLYADPLHGALVGFVISYGLVVGYWLWRSGRRFAWHIDPWSIRNAFGAGLPLILTSALDTLMISADRWAVAASSDAETLGYYALAFMAANMLGGVTTAVSNVTFPEMIRRYAAHRRPADVRSLYLGTLRALSGVLALLVCLAAPTLAFLIRSVLPKYAPSLPLALILLPTAFFMGLAYVAGPFLVAVDRAWQATLILTAVLACEVVAIVLVVYLGWATQGIAAVVLLSSMILSGAYLLPSLRLVLETWWNVLGVWCRLALPLAAGYSVVCLLSAASVPHAAYLMGVSRLASSIVAAGVTVLGVWYLLNPDVFPLRILTDAVWGRKP